jgi:hypothetical protein
MTSTTIALLSAGLTSIVGPILVHFIQLYTLNRQKNETDLIKESLETNILVENKIDEIKEKYKTDRVWVAQFHNGGYFYPTGKSIQKFSICYETVTLDVSSIKMSFQNIPVSLFSKSINQLSENDVVLIPDFKDNIVETYGLKYIAEETGCKSGYLVAIRSIDGRFIGMLGIDYVKHKTKLTEDKIASLEIEASAIGGVLMNLLNK